MCPNLRALQEQGGLGAVRTGVIPPLLSTGMPMDVDGENETTSKSFSEGGKPARSLRAQTSCSLKATQLDPQ